MKNNQVQGPYMSTVESSVFYKTNIPPHFFKITKQTPHFSLKPSRSQNFRKINPCYKSSIRKCFHLLYIILRKGFQRICLLTVRFFRNSNHRFRVFRNFENLLRMFVCLYFDRALVIQHLMSIITCSNHIITLRLMISKNRVYIRIGSFLFCVYESN